MRENLRLFAFQLLLRLLMAVHHRLQAGMNWTWGAVHAAAVKVGIEEAVESARIPHARGGELRG
ncbi:MAG: hypothetical protein Kow00120_22260 [Anaerolineae bacterium]